MHLTNEQIKDIRSKCIMETTLHALYFDVARSHNLKLANIANTSLSKRKVSKIRQEQLGFLELLRKTKHNTIVCIIVDAFIKYLSNNQHLFFFHCFLIRINFAMMAEIMHRKYVMTRRKIHNLLKHTMMCSTGVASPVHKLLEIVLKSCSFSGKLPTKISTMPIFTK